jgi:hypothetical protein
MKKQILFMVAALGLLTACDPSKDSIGMPGDSGLTSDQLTSGFTVKQYGDETYTTEAADGNYFTFTTSPSRVVTVYQLDDEGTRNVLVSGVANGKFKIVPKRGNPSQQTFFIETKDFNGNTITGEKTVNVFVPSELSPEMRLLASDSYGSKTWYWDTEFRGGPVWGNLGYAPGDGDSFCNEGNGIWWGASPEELTGQLNHSDTGVATGEESKDAYMTFDWKTGKVTSYDGSGKAIRSGNFDIQSWEGGARTQASADGSQANWAYGTLYTDAGSILFPFQINNHNDGHDNTACPTTFEIMQLDSDHLKLIYPQAGTAGWTEATWWAFKKK